jgi:hypothetical protein
VSNRQTALAALREQLGRAADHPDPAGRLNDLGTDLLALFEQTGERDALDESVAAGRAAVAATPEGDPDRAMYLNNLGNALLTLFEQTGVRGALDEAVEAERAAVAAASAEDPDRAAILTNLGNTLQALFACTGELAVLVEAVDVGRAALVAAPDDFADRAALLSNLGGALRMLFGRTGESGVLAEAVEVGRAAVDATPADHPYLAGRLNNLGNALRVSSEQTGELGVLAEAVESMRAAVAATPAEQPVRAMHLNNLGCTFLAWFERTGDQDVLEEAVETGRAAAAATSADDPDRAAILTNLGNTLLALFACTGERDVLDEAVVTERAAVMATPADHPDRAMHLSNLGGPLLALFERTGEPAVLAEAVEALRQSVSDTPAEQPDRAGRLNNLGSALRMLFEQTGEQSSLDEARRHYREAAHSTAGATILRIIAYRQLALLPADPGDSDDGLQAVEAAIDLLDTLAPGSLARADREFQLGRLANLAGEAAAAALAAGRPARAVELLERTRGILAADTLGMRDGDHTRLRDHTPRLAEELDRLRERLDVLDRPRRAGRSDFGLLDTPEAMREEDRRLAEERRESHAAWQRLLARIRRIPGFADFHRAPAISRLAGYAHEEPIVFVTTSPTRCDALILTDTADPVQVVPLTGLTHAAAYDYTDRLLAACYAAIDPDLDPMERRNAQREILSILAWLWDTVAEPVLARLGHTAAPHGDEPWSRVWWCPVGVLAFMPLHAAGHHVDIASEAGESTSPRTVLDRVVSSYTPTVRALAHARTRRSDITTCSTLIVPVPDIPGYELASVTEETRSISTLIPSARLLEHPTRAALLQALAAYQLAHFACHGEADWEDPARSTLILADHATDPLVVADILGLNLTADLAYLSACDTSVAAPRLADESLHITGAFHLAGYRNVIGTLWSVDDSASAEIAAGFYAHLTNQGTVPPRTDRSAHALHHAIRSLRANYPNTPTLWAAHTHTGA